MRLQLEVAINKAVAEEAFKNGVEVGRNQKREELAGMALVPLLNVLGPRLVEALSRETANAFKQGRAMGELAGARRVEDECIVMAPNDLLAKFGKVPDSEMRAAFETPSLPRNLSVGYADTPQPEMFVGIDPARNDGPDAVAYGILSHGIPGVARAGEIIFERVNRAHGDDQPLSRHGFFLGPNIQASFSLPKESVPEEMLRAAGVGPAALQDDIAQLSELATKAAAAMGRPQDAPAIVEMIAKLQHSSPDVPNFGEWARGKVEEYFKAVGAEMKPFYDELVISAIECVAADGPFHGTTRELKALLEDKYRLGFVSFKQLSNYLRELEPRLKELGVLIQWQDDEAGVYWVIAQLPEYDEDAPTEDEQDAIDGACEFFSVRAKTTEGLGDAVDRIGAQVTEIERLIADNRVILGIRGMDVLQAAAEVIRWRIEDIKKPPRKLFQDNLPRVPEDVKAKPLADQPLTPVSCHSCGHSDGVNDSARSTPNARR